MPTSGEGLNNRGTNSIAPVKIWVQEANTSQSSEPWADLYNHNDLCVIGEHCLVVHDYDHPVSVS